MLRSSSPVAALAVTLAGPSTLRLCAHAPPVFRQERISQSVPCARRRSRAAAARRLHTLILQANAISWETCWESVLPPVTLVLADYIGIFMLAIRRMKLPLP